MIRPARPEDAPHLAELANEAGDGLPFLVWSGLAGPGEDPWDVGRSRARRESGSFSFRNASFADLEGEVAACLIGYRLPDEPTAIDANMPALFVPLQELENLAPSTWYVNVLAAYPKWRNRGLGGMLLRHAEDLAKATGAGKGMSVIIADNNAGARRLYERSGYRLADTRPLVRGGWRSEAANWQLLVKSI
jgi:ribosomal protein S18 acetylase RimI-like enzyme